MDWALILTMAIIGTLVGFRVSKDTGRPTLGASLGFLFGMALAEKPEPQE